MLGLRSLTTSFRGIHLKQNIPLNFASNIVPSSIFSSFQVGKFLSNFQAVRFMNKNARRPNKANHGKRPVSHCRRRAQKNQLQSRAYKQKIFGFW
mmetsp:Transcript_33696/g.32162  ORF Transcript_33696/g.32162 Transcript_33696/m.32162 type:complete len:95 (+) Transcript_33696:88-372(+)